MKEQSNKNSPEMADLYLTSGRTSLKRGNHEEACNSLGDALLLYCTKTMSYEDPKILEVLQAFSGMPLPYIQKWLDQQNADEESLPLSERNAHRLLSKIY